MAEFIESTFMDGYVGGPHVTEDQMGLANQALYGQDDYVLEGGREAEAQILTNNSIRIFDAIFAIQGRRDVIAANDYEDVSIDNGAQGMNRNDIIVRRYTKDESSEIESTSYAVIKGTPTAGVAVDPEVPTGDIRNGATLHNMKLYRVKIEGLSIVEIEPVFNILYNMDTIKKKIADLNSKLLWTNPNPSAQMSSLTINLDLGSYDAVKIVYKQATSGNVIHIKECIVGSNTTLSQTFAYDTSYPITYSREVKISSDSISVLNGYAQGGSAAGASKPNSAVCIPVYVYGCKL